MSDFTIVTRTVPYCGYCQSAKSLLRSKGVSYKEINYEVVQEELEALNLNWRTLPFVFQGVELTKETFVGGFDQLRKLL